MATSMKKDLSVRHLGPSGRQPLRILLTPESDIGNWKMLAEKMEFTMEEIAYFATKPEPVDSILDCWQEKNGSSATIKVLLDYLQEIGRYDAVEDLNKYIEEMSVSNENGQPSSMNASCQQRITGSRDITEEDQNNITRSDQIYDALICYAKEDAQIAEELLTTFENPPYSLRLCIDYRDFGVGGDHLTNLATIIEQRVKRIIVILTKNFLKCDQCDYQAKVALNLSPGCRQKRVIPVLYEEDVEIPIILKHITLLNYTRPEVQKYFNDRLAMALGFKSSGLAQEQSKTCAATNRNPQLKHSLSQEQPKPCAAKNKENEMIEKETALKAEEKADKSICSSEKGTSPEKHGKTKSLFKHIKKGRKK